MEGLELTFKQKVIESKFYKSITFTSQIKHETFCKTCNTDIYPVQWTDDIERVFEYQKKHLHQNLHLLFLRGRHGLP